MDITGIRTYGHTSTQPIVGVPDDVGKSLSPRVHLPFMEGGLPSMVIPFSVGGWDPESTGLTRYSEIASYIFMSDVPAIIIYDLEIRP